MKKTRLNPSCFAAVATVIAMACSALHGVPQSKTESAAVSSNRKIESSVEASVEKAGSAAADKKRASFTESISSGSANDKTAGSTSSESSSEVEIKDLTEADVDQLRDDLLMIAQILNPMTDIEELTDMPEEKAENLQGKEDSKEISSKEGKNVPGTEENVIEGKENVFVGKKTAAGKKEKVIGGKANVFAGEGNTGAPAVRMISAVALARMRPDRRCLYCLDQLDDNSKFETLGGFTVMKGQKMLLEEQIEKTKKEGYDIGFVMIDIETGQGIAYNAKTKFYSASTIKGPFIISEAYRKPEDIPKWERTMSAIAVTSDNNLYSSLFKTCGTVSYKLWCTRAGVDGTLTKSQYTDYSAEDLARLWTLAYQYFDEDKENGERVGEWFEKPNYSAIHKVLDGIFKTRTKGGWIAVSLQAANDAGIVYAGDSPYVVAITSNYPSRLDKLEPYVRLLEGIHASISGEMDAIGKMHAGKTAPAAQNTGSGSSNTAGSSGLSKRPSSNTSSSSNKNTSSGTQNKPSGNKPGNNTDSGAGNNSGSGNNTAGGGSGSSSGGNVDNTTPGGNTQGGAAGGNSGGGSGSSSGGNTDSGSGSEQSGSSGSGSGNEQGGSSGGGSGSEQGGTSGGGSGSEQGGSSGGSSGGEQGGSGSGSGSESGSSSGGGSGSESGGSSGGESGGSSGSSSGGDSGGSSGGGSGSESGGSSGGSSGGDSGGSSGSSSGGDSGGSSGGGSGGDSGSSGGGEGGE